MAVLAEYPPIWERINAKFGLKARRLQPIFAWGNDIYNPFRVLVSRHLMAHEAAHGMRQNVIGIEKWWDMYLDFDEFRLAEEVIAHRAEMEARFYAEGTSRQTRRMILAQTAKRLASPLYRYKCSSAQARRLLQDYEDKDYALVPLPL